MVYIWRLEDNLGELIFSFYDDVIEGTGHQIQVVGLVSLYPLSPQIILLNLRFTFFVCVCARVCLCVYIGSLELKLQVDVSCWMFMLGPKFRSWNSSKHPSLRNHAYLTMQIRILTPAVPTNGLSLFPFLTFFTFCYPKGFTVLL